MVNLPSFTETSTVQTLPEWDWIGREGTRTAAPHGGIRALHTNGPSGVRAADEGAAARRHRGVSVPRSAAEARRSTRATACSRSSARSTRPARSRRRRAARPAAARPAPRADDPRRSRRGRARARCSIIAAALGLQDPRERPQAAQQSADEAHRKFRDEGSDFARYLKLWAFWQEARGRTHAPQLHKLCRENFLVVQPHARVGGHPRAARPRDARAGLRPNDSRPPASRSIARCCPGCSARSGCGTRRRGSTSARARRGSRSIRRRGSRRSRRRG